MQRLPDILDLVGPLDDAPGDETARERFRTYLRRQVMQTGQIRDFVQVCLSTSGTQYNRALQDLVNRVGELMGFDVDYGRYQGVVNEVGFDGVWRLAAYSVVVEVKTTDAYAVTAATLAGYVDHLISAKKISDWGHALGLYVVGRSDKALAQMSAAITAEGRVDRLRVVTADSLLNLAEMIQTEALSAEEGLSLLRPAGAVVDDVVALLSRLAFRGDRDGVEPDPVLDTASPVLLAAPPAAGRYILTPVADSERRTAREALEALLGGGWYAYGDRTPTRKVLAPGDRMCFYEVGTGVVAVATVASAAEREPAPKVADPRKHPWRFRVKDVRFLEQPVVIDAALRRRLSAFAGRDPEGPWAWYVQQTHAVSEADFSLLIGDAA